jgi:hypothetical protein
MSDLKVRLSSRKFLGFAGTMLMLAASVLTGDAKLSDVTWPAVAALLGYLGVQGAIDLKEKKNDDGR